ncbi:hypothetical protein ACP70R_027250 [Stipagrostis hirtigluma subsp. patula]
MAGPTDNGAIGASGSGPVHGCRVCDVYKIGDDRHFSTVFPCTLSDGRYVSGGIPHALRCASPC